MRKKVFLRMLVLLIAACGSVAAFAQNRKVTGTITDNKQAPLVGATIAVKGTKEATTTDASGNFSINIPNGRNTLVISYIGMQAREFVLGNSDLVSIALTPSSGTLDDVVVVGYGRARKANLTTAQTSVSAREIEKTVNTTVEQ